MEAFFVIDPVNYIQMTIMILVTNIQLVMFMISVNNIQMVVIQVHDIMTYIIWLMVMFMISVNNIQMVMFMIYVHDIHQMVNGDVHDLCQQHTDDADAALFDHEANFCSKFNGLIIIAVFFRPLFHL